jgi:hypothetical protein
MADRYVLADRTVVDVVDTETGNALTTYREEEREAAQAYVDELNNPPEPVTGEEGEEVVAE